MTSQRWTINLDGSRGMALEIVDLPGIEREKHDLDTLNFKPVEGTGGLEIEGGAE